MTLLRNKFLHYLKKIDCLLLRPNSLLYFKREGNNVYFASVYQVLDLLIL